MTALNFPGPSIDLRSWLKWRQENVLGFLYWLAFLLVLEPGNVSRAIQSGHVPAFGHEAVRIVVAALLGATVTPILLMLTRRFPMLGASRWRHMLIHSMSASGLAFGLILASCFLAAWIFERAWQPSLTEVRVQLVANWLLLIYALFAFSAIAHAIHVFKQIKDQPPASDKAQHLTSVPVKTRGRISFVSLASVDWIETQGNYLALHVGSDIHLIRETLVKFEPQLDPSRFVRIHRRAIVAVDSIRDIQPAANGDAILRLKEGRELRVSRRYRDAIKDKWHRSESAANSKQPLPVPLTSRSAAL